MNFQITTQRAALKDADAYGGGKNSITYKTYSKLDDKSLTDDDIINNTLEQVRMNNKVKELGADTGIFRNDGGGFDNNN